MPNFSHLKSIEQGTVIKIKARGMIVRGKVHSANNWGYNYPDTKFPTPDNWYIELYDEDGQYRYWKQESDGGELLEVHLNE